MARAYARGLCALLVSVAASLFGSGETRACELSDGPRHAVSRVIDGETLALDDGREVRLIGALAPRAFDSGAATTAWPPEEDARAALERLVLGRSVKLAFGSRRVDRYGRILAHVFIDEPATAERTWVQGAMIDAGFARAYALPGAADCLDQMIAREVAARSATRGIWANAAYAVRDAARTSELLRHRATHQLVEGRVRRVATVGSRIYLNFGEDWRRDFTVGIEKARRTRTPDGVDPVALEGARVRVRGWIDRRNGPFVELADLTAIEVLEPAVVPGQTSTTPAGEIDPGHPSALSPARSQAEKQ